MNPLADIRHELTREGGVMFQLSDEAGGKHGMQPFDRLIEMLDETHALTQPDHGQQPVSFREIAARMDAAMMDAIDKATKRKGGKIDGKKALMLMMEARAELYWDALNLLCDALCVPRIDRSDTSAWTMPPWQEANRA